MPGSHPSWAGLRPPRLDLACSIIVFSFLFSSARTAIAQDASVEELEAQIQALSESPTAEIAAEEIERARLFLRLASEAREAGHGGVADGLLSLIPLQIRLVREILRAVEAERHADELEREVDEAVRASRREREALERALERVRSLTVLREGD